MHDWFITAVIFMFLAWFMFTNSFLTLIDGECEAFHFLNKHVGRHIMFIFQDDNVKIQQALISRFSPDLKFVESPQDVLEETLQSAGVLHCQDKILTKCMHLLMEMIVVIL